MGNTFGHNFRITTFGESHGKAVGCVVDGCPANLSLSEKDIQAFLDLRRPGKSKFTSPRNEADMCEIVSGVYEGKTLGSPICVIIYNQDKRSQDYEDIKNIYRPGHADYSYQQKYKYEKTPPGGGRASARETIGRVIGGAIAKCYVKSKLPNVHIDTFIKRIHNVTRNNSSADQPVLTPEMEEIILRAKNSGDTVGGCIETTIANLPAGFGDPVFNKLEADLAKAMLSIPAAKFFESGDGIDATYKFGSENNDEFYFDEKEKLKTKTNNSGGILGGISNGMPVTFRVGFKPVSTIFKEQDTVSKAGFATKFTPQSGRHDPCVLPRALIIVESMSWLVLADKLFFLNT